MKSREKEATEHPESRLRAGDDGPREQPIPDAPSPCAEGGAAGRPAEPAPIGLAPETSPPLARSSLFAGMLVILMFGGFCWYNLVRPDPTTQPGFFKPRDRRKHRYGRFSYRQTRRLLRKIRRTRRRTRSRDGKAIMSVRLADIFVERKMLKRALEELKKARKLAPRRPQVLVRYAVVCHHLGRRGEALRVIEQARKLAPGSPGVRRGLSVILKGNRK